MIISICIWIVLLFHVSLERFWLTINNLDMKSKLLLLSLSVFLLAACTHQTCPTYAKKVTEDTQKTEHRL